MKLLPILLLVSLNAFAATVEFVGPCEQEPLVSEIVQLNETSNVGQVTVDLLKKLDIPFEGTPRGMNSIFETPTGMDAYEVISDTEMLAYGWCYSVNGFEPGVYSDEFPVSNDDEILWWFGYAQYKDGQWITQCTPSYERRSPMFCSDL